MSTVAVVGSRGTLGRAVLTRLRAAPGVSGVTALADPADPLPAVDVVVQLPTDEHGREAVASPHSGRVVATRTLLEAVTRAGARRLVHVSSAAAYGAHPDNDVPLTESSPLRAGPDFAPGYNALLAEEVVSDWARRHPQVQVTTLRPATMLGPGVDDVVTRHLESPRLPLVRGHEPPVQFVHVDDVAAAVVCAVAMPSPGAFNVAAEGWLPVSDVVGLLGRRVLWLPEEVAFATGDRLWRQGLLSTPPGALHYLMYPWVISCDRLHEQGWTPRYSNREILRQFAAAHDAYLSLGRVRIRRRRLYGSLATVAGAAAVAAATLLRIRSDHRTRS